MRRFDYSFLKTISLDMSLVKEGRIEKIGAGPTTRYFRAR